MTRRGVDPRCRLPTTGLCRAPPPVHRGVAAGGATTTLSRVKPPRPVPCGAPSRAHSRGRLRPHAPHISPPPPFQPLRLWCLQPPPPPTGSALVDDASAFRFRAPPLPSPSPLPFPCPLPRLPYHPRLLPLCSLLATGSGLSVLHPPPSQLPPMSRVDGEAATPWGEAFAASPTPPLWRRHTSGARRGGSSGGGAAPVAVAVAGVPPPLPPRPSAGHDLPGDAAAAKGAGPGLFAAAAAALGSGRRRLSVRALGWGLPSSPSRAPPSSDPSDTDEEGWVAWRDSPSAPRSPQVAATDPAATAGAATPSASLSASVADPVVAADSRARA